MAPRKKRTTNNRNSLQDKKNVIIADFKKQVKQRSKQMQKDLEIVLNKADNIYKLKELSLNSVVKHMKVHDFIASGGNVERAIEKLEENIEKTIDANIAETLAKELPPRSKKNIRIPPPSEGRSLRSCRKKMYPADVTDINVEDSDGTIKMKFMPNQTPATAFRLPLPGEVTYSIRGSPVITKFVGERQKMQ